MKKYIYSLLMVLTCLSFGACEDETSQDQSVITYYATLELLGDKEIFWDLNTPYVDPGYVSEMQGEDVTDQVVVTGTVDYKKGGNYHLKYSITNKDGFSVTDSRIVRVVDRTPSPIGTMERWVCDHAVSYRNYTNEDNTITKTAYKGAFEIFIFQLAPGHFYISDFLAGWYDQGAGYGFAYAMEGEFMLNADNTITPLKSFVAGWGDKMDEMTDAKFDPVANTISYKVFYGDVMEFNVTLTKK